MANSLADNAAMPGVDPAAMDGMEDAPGDIQSLGPEIDKTAMQTPPPDPNQKQISVDELIEYIQKQSFVDGKLRALLNSGEPISRKKMTQTAIEIVAKRVLSAQAMAGYLKDLPAEPEAIREWVEKHAKEAETQLEQLLTMLQGTVDPTVPMGAFGEAPPEEAPPEEPIDENVTGLTPQ